MQPSDLLRRARERSGLTQAQLARAAGTSQPVISAYEHGQRDPSIGTLERLIHAAGHELRLDAVRPTLEADRLPPPRSLDEHGQRLVEVLHLAEAIPRRQPRSPELDVPRMVSTSRRG